MTAPPSDLSGQVANAVALFWQTRSRQVSRQADSGKRDQGARGAVTGGAQMDGFVELLAELAAHSGIPCEGIHHDRRAELHLPGYFRATKQWDLLIVHLGMLLAAVEVKSHVGSFGNNANNRAEEALGSAVDLWTAYRENAFTHSPQPWLGYLLLLQDSPASRRPVGVREPHFKTFEEFHGASYVRRYELLCRRLVLERHYTCAALLTSREDDGVNGQYEEPAADLAFAPFARSFLAHISAYGGK